MTTVDTWTDEDMEHSYKVGYKDGGVDAFYFDPDPLGLRATRFSFHRLDETEPAREYYKSALGIEYYSQPEPAPGYFKREVTIQLFRWVVYVGLGSREKES